MKPNRFPRSLHALGLAAILLTAQSIGHAEEPLSTIEVQGRFIYASREQMKTAFDAAKLPEVPAAPLTAEQFKVICNKLRNLRLEFFSRPQALTMSGRKAVIDANREFRYPTRFDQSPQLGKNFQFAETFPATFETRYLGVTLEFTGIATSDGFIDLTLATKVTNFLGFIDYPAQKSAQLGDMPTLEDWLKMPLTAGGHWQPVFSSFTSHTKATLQSGQTVFFGGPMKVELIKTSKGPMAPRSTRPDQQVFVFVTAKAIPQE